MAQYTPLPASALTAYSDLVAALLQAPASARGVSYITRTVKGRRYWYLQYVIGEQKKSWYLGPDTPELNERIEAARKLVADDAADRPLRERLVATGVAAGLSTVSLAEGRIYEALVQTGVFDAGAVLLGTHAFLAIGNQLGVTWLEPTRTEDIDIGHDPQFRLATPDHDQDLETALRHADRGFFAVPSLNREAASTRFRIRGQQLSVSLLTPLRGKPDDRPVLLPHLNVAAEPVRYLEYLMDDAQPAAILFGAGVLVRLPHPARFAIHKLVVSQRRRARDAARSRKDIAQASALLECLHEFRSGDIQNAVGAASDMPKRFHEYLQAGLSAIPAELRDSILAHSGAP